MNASADDIALAVLAFLGTAVPILAGLYISTRMADRGVDARLCWVVGFAVLLAGWGVLLLPALYLEKQLAPAPPMRTSQKVESGD
jgi:hypothetical protein